MRYRLDDLGELAAELGFRTRRVSSDRLDVTVQDGYVLAFCNLPDEEDVLVGFDGTPWHTHGAVLYETGRETYAEYDELDVLIGLASGDLLVVSSVRDGQVADRWIAHKGEGLELRYMEPGEELQVLRLTARKTRAE